MDKLKYKMIAVDFDGTLVVDNYPDIITLKPHAKRVMQRIRDAGGHIAIWTARGNLEDVYLYLLEHHVPFDNINSDFAENVKKYPYQSRKIFADVYIDDRSLFAPTSIDWLEVEEKLFE